VGLSHNVISCDLHVIRGSGCLSSRFYQATSLLLGPPPPDYDLNRIPRCAILDVDVRPLTKNIFGSVASGYIKMGARPRHLELESKLEDKLKLCRIISGICLNFTIFIL
jgi:hypothetical protein